MYDCPQDSKKGKWDSELEEIAKIIESVSEVQRQWLLAAFSFPLLSITANTCA